MLDKDYIKPRYLERYQEGHYREVWDELVLLGPSIFEDRFYTEALAVARVMMQRVRFNIEMLLAKLLQCGFVFGYDFRLQDQLIRSLTSAHERNVYRERRNWVHEQPLVFLPAKQREEEIAETQQWLKQDPSLKLFFEGQSDDEKQLMHTEPFLFGLKSIVEPVPIAVQAWFEEIEEVNFYGYYPPWNELLLSFHGEPSSERNSSVSYLMSSCDPFQIGTPNEQKLMHLKEEYLVDKSCRLEFAPDHDFKDFYGGASTPYGFVLPQASIDAMMSTPYGSTTFVEYIRLSMVWAGFPGMMQWPDVPRADLEFLTRDLLPF